MLSRLVVAGIALRDQRFAQKRQLLSDGAGQIRHGLLNGRQAAFGIVR